MSRPEHCLMIEWAGPTLRKVTLRCPEHGDHIAFIASADDTADVIVMWLRDTLGRERCTVDVLPLLGE